MVRIRVRVRVRARASATVRARVGVRVRVGIRLRACERAVGLELRQVQLCGERAVLGLPTDVVRVARPERQR
eukprot:scaffold115260_cov61-Phaeocystis_antarctica.AAC.1